MTPTEFAAYLDQHRPLFKSWGELVRDRVLAGLGVRAEAMLKVPPQPRVKQTNSALAKIIRKGYTDPLQQMTDLVGIRFVVLLHEHLQPIREVIEACCEWEHSPDRDFEVEIAKHPKVFDYQSIHYVVRSRAGLTFGGVVIPEGLPCEIQVRTLLQHAYAEVVHDNIYKPQGAVASKVERLAARSMALMETTDVLLADTVRLLDDVNLHRDQLLKDLELLYREVIGVGFLQLDKAINLTLLEEYAATLDGSATQELRALIERKKYIATRVKEYASTDIFFRQPVSLLVYLLVEKSIDTARSRWPLPGAMDAFEQICSDLGVTLHKE